MTSDRPYRSALPLQAAREEVERGAEILFDPHVASMFLAISNETWELIRAKATMIQARSVVTAGRVETPSRLAKSESSAESRV
jgi:HD-GYP domain-containing protein (c-di-GMP phosphodiesterase class II)